MFDLWLGFNCKQCSRVEQHLQLLCAHGCCCCSLFLFFKCSPCESSRLRQLASEERYQWLLEWRQSDKDKHIASQSKRTDCGFRPEENKHDSLVITFCLFFCCCFFYFQSPQKYLFTFWVTVSNEDRRTQWLTKPKPQWLVVLQELQMYVALQCHEVVVLKNCRHWSLLEQAYCAGDIFAPNCCCSIDLNNISGETVKIRRRQKEIDLCQNLPKSLKV